MRQWLLTSAFAASTRSPVVRCVRGGCGLSPQQTRWPPCAMRQSRTFVRWRVGRHSNSALSRPLQSPSRQSWQDCTLSWPLPRPAMWFSAMPGRPSAKTPSSGSQQFSNGTATSVQLVRSWRSTAMTQRPILPTAHGQRRRFITSPTSPGRRSSEAAIWGRSWPSSGCRQPQHWSGWLTVAWRRHPLAKLSMRSLWRRSGPLHTKTWPISGTHSRLCRVGTELPQAMTRSASPRRRSELSVCRPRCRCILASDQSTSSNCSRDGRPMYRS